MARLRPGANAVASTMVRRPSLRSCRRLRAPSARLAPPVSIARRSAAGLESSSSVGLVALTNCCRWKRSRSRSAGSRSSASPSLQQEVRGQQVHVLERPVDRVGMPFRRVEPLVAGRSPRVVAWRSPAPPAGGGDRSRPRRRTSPSAGSGRPSPSARDPGRQGDRSQTVRRARTTSAQSTGITSCSGLAFHADRSSSASGRWPGPCGAGRRPRTACRRRSRRA